MIELSYIIDRGWRREKRGSRTNDILGLSDTDEINSHKGQFQYIPMFITIVHVSKLTFTNPIIYFIIVALQQSRFHICDNMPQIIFMLDVATLFSHYSGQIDDRDGDGTFFQLGKASPQTFNL